MPRCKRPRAGAPPAGPPDLLATNSREKVEKPNITPGRTVDGEMAVMGRAGKGGWAGGRA